MCKDMGFIKWFNTASKWDEKYLYMDIALLDFGFTDHSWVKGLATVKKNLTLEELKRLANEAFFENFRENIPCNIRSHSDIEPEPEMGSILCLIDGDKYTAQYNYSKKELLFIDQTGGVLNT